MSQEVLEHSTRGALTSHLETKWVRPGVFWGGLHLRHLALMAGAVVSID